MAALLAIGLSARSQTPVCVTVEDIIEAVTERDPEADVQEVEERLAELERHPIDLNRATSEDLEQLFWLTSEQIDAILLYVYHHPMQTVYELQLVGALQDYEIRTLLPFVTVVPKEQGRKTLADEMRTASHEVDLRLDARNLEQIEGDPVYASVRYSMQGGDRIRLGAVVKRDAGEIPSAKSRYGAYLQLNDIWRFRTIVAGDYRAKFGLGLVMNSGLSLGKSSMAASLGMTQQGLRKYGGASDVFLRGAGATMRIGRVDLSAFYSIRMPDSIWRQTAGVNATYRHKRLMVGLTAVNYWTKDSVAIRNTYYNTNYWRGKNQLAASVSFQYGIRSVMLLGELATAQNTHWGAAGLLGLRFQPADGVSLLTLARYYSPYYDAKYATAFGETSRNNDEHGIYVGTEVNRIRHWRLSGYADFFCFSGPKYQIRDSLTWGYDLMAQARFVPSERTDMLWKIRVRRKGQKELYSMRYQLNDHWKQASLRTQIDANLGRPDLEPLQIGVRSGNTGLSGEAGLQDEDEETLTYGVSVMEQVEYRAAKVPLVLQLRLQGFYIPWYDNRIYSYENDVLYAFSIPMAYGTGVRYYANLRYRINDIVGLYLRVSDSWYTRTTPVGHPYEWQHKTDIHLLLRLTM